MPVAVELKTELAQTEKDKPGQHEADCFATRAAAAETYVLNIWDLNLHGYLKKKKQT